LIRLLLSRLERVSADSYWAHRASGIRGSLLKALDGLETGTSAGHNSMDELVSAAFEIHTRAAKGKSER